MSFKEKYFGLGWILNLHLTVVISVVILIDQPVGKITISMLSVYLYTYVYIYIYNLYIYIYTMYVYVCYIYIHIFVYRIKQIHHEYLYVYYVYYIHCPTGLSHHLTSELRVDPGLDTSVPELLSSPDAARVHYINYICV